MTRNPAQFFHAGAARVDITPPLGTLINGFFLPRKAITIHDDLFVKAVYMESENTRLALVVVDTCVIALDYARQIRLQVEEVTGIPFQHICVSTTHTHAGGSVSEVHLCGPDPAYTEMLPVRIIEAVQQAIQNTRPARIAFGSAQVPEHVLCRRYIMKPGFHGTNPVTGKVEEVVTNPFGAVDGIAGSAATTDPEVGYIAIQDLEGNWISILANYSLHYVGDVEKGSISADYFGEFERQLNQRLEVAAGFVGIMSNGTSGDVNCWDFLHPKRYATGHFQKSKLIAGDIVDRLVSSLAKIIWEETPELSVQYDELKLGMRKPALEEMTVTEKIMQETDYTTLVMNEDGLRRMFAREQVLLYDFPEFIDYPLQVFRIGQGMIGSLCGEIFAATGLHIKSESPTKKYFTICLANGNVGYIPPAHEIERGGYETWRCRSSCLKPESESLIRHRFVQLLQQFS